MGKILEEMFSQILIKGVPYRAKYIIRKLSLRPTLAMHKMLTLFKRHF